MGGKNICENILLCQEIINRYHKDTKEKRCTIKVDLIKAYDSLNWDSIGEVFSIIGILSRCIDWIMNCFTNLSFLVCLNGKLVGFFKGLRVLKQGDLIFLFLFVMAMKVFFYMLKELKFNPNFGYH